MAFLLGGRDVVGNGDHFAGRMFAVDEGAFEGEIDKAGDDPVLHQRQLAQHQRCRTCRLQPLQHVMRPRIRLVDLVDENEMRHAQLIKRLENHLQGRRLLLIRLADHNGRITGRQHMPRVLGKFDRAWAIDEGEAFTHELRCCGVELHAHIAGARFGGRIADGGLIRNFALARDRAAAVQYGLQQGCLAALIGAHQCNTPWSPCCSTVLRNHVIPPTLLLLCGPPSGGSQVNAARDMERLCLFRRVGKTQSSLHCATAQNDLNKKPRHCCRGFIKSSEVSYLVVRL